MLTCKASPQIQKQINKALKEYKKTWEKSEDVFEEFCFCLLTPQSSARKAELTINLLKKNNLLSKGSAKEKEPFMKNIRFYITKARRLEIAQKEFPKNKIKKILIENKIEKDPLITREFLVKNVNGFGYKEASHFMRNIGFYEDIAILDRHILRNLVKCGVLLEIPKTITKKTYLEIEEKMKNYCKKHKINFAELDLIFWSNETGEVFK